MRSSSRTDVLSRSVERERDDGRNPPTSTSIGLREREREIIPASAGRDGKHRAPAPLSAAGAKRKMQDAPTDPLGAMRALLDQTCNAAGAVAVPSGPQALDAWCEQLERAMPGFV